MTRQGAVQIKNPDVVRDIRRLAELTKRPITDVVADAVREPLAKAEESAKLSIAERERKIDEILAAFRALPKTGEWLTDEDLYDEEGFPK